MTICLTRIDPLDLARYLGRKPVEVEPLTLDWATSRERQRVIARAIQDGRQTMNLRTMPGAELVVARGSDGRLAGWGGVDVGSDPQYPEMFSWFVCAEFRGVGLGALFEYVALTKLDHAGCSTAFVRMGSDADPGLVERHLASGHYQVVRSGDLPPRFVGACRKCELFDNACRRQVFLAVDVRKALAASATGRGPLDLAALPLRIPEGAERFRRFPAVG